MSRARLPTVLGLIVSISMLVGCQWSSQTETVPIETIQPQSFRRVIEINGFLEAKDATPLLAPANLERSATIAWLAEPGSYVQQGEVVVKFDPAPLEKELEDSEATKESQLKRMQSARIMGQKEREDLIKDEYLADRELYFAETFTSQDGLIFNRHERIEAEIDQTLAQKKKTHAESTRVVRTELNDVELDLLGIGVAQAQTKIDRALNDLNAMSIEAPHDGILVLQNRWGGDISVGESIWRGQQVGKIPSLESMEADLWVLEADAAGLKEGAAVELRVESNPNRVFQGEVISVARLPSRRMRRNPAQYFKLRANIQDATPEDAPYLKPGARVSATLVLDAREDALTVPRSAVMLKDGARWVRKRTSTGFEDVEVKLGPSNLGRVVIEEGLSAGDVVAIGDPTDVMEPTQENGDGSPLGAGGMP